MNTRLIATVASFATATALLSPLRAPAGEIHRSAVRIGTQSAQIATSLISIKPFSTIYAQVTIVDSGTSLTIAGKGSGFNSTLSYTSFFYGAGSVSTGSLACIPPTPNNLTVPQMITAYWLPVGSSRRTLTLVNSGSSYTPLSTIGTMSVRYDTTPTLPLSQNLNPGRFWLNSCGVVKAHL